MKYVLKIFLSFLLFVISSCGDKKLTQEECLDKFLSLDYVEGAKFYRDNLESQEWVPLTYHKYIVPILADADIITLKEVLPILEGTTAGRKLTTSYITKKNEYLKDVNSEIDELTYTAKETFIEEVLPLIEMALDSIMEKEVHEAVEKYSGGIMNFRKIGLLFDSDNMAKLMNCCKEKIIPQHYEECVKLYIKDFLNTAYSVQNEYLKNLCKEEIRVEEYNILINFDLPNENTFNKSRNEIEKLNAEEMNDLMWDLGRAGIDIGAGFLSRGWSIAYECVSFAYDAYDIYQDFQDPKLEFNEVLELALNDIFSENISKELPSLKIPVFSCLENNALNIKLAIQEAL